ncbi:MAG: hypothetical protein V3U50_07040 [Acidimicrobiia bacterium]
MKTRVLLIAVTLLLVAAACGDGTGRTGDASDPFGIDAGSTSSSSSGATSSSTTSSTTTTTTTTMATTTTQAGDHVVYQDPVGDCLDGTTNEPAPACLPAATDILTVTMSRASPFTVVIEIAEPGRPGLGESYQFTLALDLDQDRTTGIIDFWPEFHAMGPDLETDYFGSSTSDEVFVQAYAIEGQNGFELLDPPPVEWTWLDDTHLQAVFEMEAVGDGAFGFAGDLFTGTDYDHFVDHGHVVFPSGEVVLVG